MVDVHLDLDFSNELFDIALFANHVLLDDFHCTQEPTVAVSAYVNSTKFSLSDLSAQDKVL